MLSTWLSFGDLARLVTAAVEAPRSGHCVIWACSNNPASFWGRDHRDRIGWAPQDSAETFRDKVGNLTSGNPVIERYQGGGYCAVGYSRDRPSPADAFALEE
jgi:uronate dehydrogenase